MLPINELRCLAHTAATITTRPPEWCELRHTCARALAVRSDISDLSRRTAYRVCNDDEVDSFVEFRSE